MSDLNSRAVSWRPATANVVSPVALTLLSPCLSLCLLGGKRHVAPSHHPAPDRFLGEFRLRLSPGQRAGAGLPCPPDRLARRRPDTGDRLRRGHPDSRAKG